MKRAATVLGVYGAVFPFVSAVQCPALFDGWFPLWSRHVSAALSVITSPLPFPVAEAAAYAAIAAVPAYWTVTFMKHRSFMRALKVTLVWVAALAAAFVWFWGLNYFCPPPSARMGIEASPSSKDDLILTAARFRDALNAAYVPVGGADFGTLAGGVVNGYESLSERYAFLISKPARPKKLTFGIVQSYLGISGIYIPWTGESCVVGDTPAPNLPATMAHELAHRQGAAAEDEASFIGILACLYSDDPRVRYSGFFYAFIHLSNAVYRQDRDAHAELWSGLDAEIAEDMAEVSRHYAKYEGPASEVGEAVNDAYLKTMRQTEGVKSYGMVVDLLIACPPEMIP